MDLRLAGGHQLKPGVAANQDSLDRLLDAIGHIGVQRAQSDQQALRELAQFLNPVQRARLLVMRQRMKNRVDVIRRGGPMGQGMGIGEGMGPGMGPGQPLRPGQVRRPRMPRDSQPEF